MSWSIVAVGKPEPVLAKVRDDISRITCSEPEQTIKAQALATIEAALAGYADGTAVKVEASGSQWSADGRSVSQNVRVQVEPLYGFVE